MRRALVIAIIAATLFAALSLMAVFRLVEANSRLEDARSALLSARSEASANRIEDGWLLAVHNRQLTSVEPTGDAAIVGYYRARVVTVAPDGYAITFDWIGYKPDPHSPVRTNTSRHTQTLRGQPFAFIKVAAKGTSNRPIPVVSATLRDTLQSMRSNDATGRALLATDWWVGVQGDHWTELVQAP